MCNECGFYWEDHWYDAHMVMLCPTPVDRFRDFDPPDVEWDWTEEDEMLFNSFSEYMNG